MSGVVEDQSAPEKIYFPMGELTNVGAISLDLSSTAINTRLNLELSAPDGELTSSYPVWVYVDEIFNEKAREVLSEGGKVYLTPPSTKEAMPHSIKAQFSTDFWSVGTFPNQEGAMGQLIDSKHQIFENFPTEGYTNYQWWPMATQRALILPEYIDTIITEMDCYAYLRPMTQLMEVNCGGGKLMISSMGLQNLQQYPEARALLRSIYTYMNSDKFEPVNEMSIEAVEALFKLHRPDQQATD